MRPDLSIAPPCPPPGGDVRVAVVRELGTHAPPWATMPGWLVMTAGTGCCGGWSLCPFWTGSGPRGYPNGCPLSPPLLPRPPSGPGTGPPGADSGPWPWASAAGFGLVAWGLGTEAPTRAEWQKYIEQQKDLMRKRGIQVPATAARTETSAARRRLWNALDVLGSSIRMVFGVRYGLRRLTVLAIADEAWNVVFYGLRVPRAVQRRKPRIAAGSALVVAGSVARLRAASAEPLR